MADSDPDAGVTLLAVSLEVLLDAELSGEPTEGHVKKFTRRLRVKPNHFVEFEGQSLLVNSVNTILTLVGRSELIVTCLPEEGLLKCPEELEGSVIAQYHTGLITEV